MPLYEYTCRKCKQEFELLRSLEERDDQCECPHCRAKGRMTRHSSLVSAAGRFGTDNPVGSCGPAGSPFT